MCNRRSQRWFFTLAVMILISLLSHSREARAVSVLDPRFGVVLQGQSPVQTLSRDAGVVIGEIPFNASADLPFTITPTSGTTRGGNELFTLSVLPSTPPGTYLNKKVQVNFHHRLSNDLQEGVGSVAVVPNPVLSAVVLAAGGLKRVASSTVDFGSVVVGNRVSRTIEIRNNSASQVVIQATFTGFNPNTFGIRSSLPANLAPGASQSIDFEFPLQFNLGQHQATVKFSSEVVGLPEGNVPVPAPAGQLVVPLKGTLLSNINIPTVLDFGAVSLNSSQQKLLDVVNLSSARILISVPPTAGPFQLAPPVSPLDTAGARASIVVTLPAQPSAGSIAAALSVQVSDGDQGDIPEVKTVTIKANVVGSAQADLIPVIVGTPSIAPAPNNPQNSSVTFQLRVDNSGSASQACEAQVLLAGALEKTITIGPIGSGSSSLQEVKFQTDKHGARQLKVRVDTNNANAESDETNNTSAPLSIDIP